MKIENVKLNSVPSITWNWLKSNNDTLTIDGSFVEQKAVVSGAGKAFSITSTSKADFDVNQIFSGVFNVSNPKVTDNRLADGSFIDRPKVAPVSDSEHPVSKLIKSVAPESELITISGKMEQPLILNFDFKGDTVSSQLIHAKADSEGTVIFVYKGDAECSILQTKVFAEENAKLHIIKVQLLGSKAVQLDDTGVVCNDNAHVHFTQIELGAAHVDSGLHVGLKGYQSSFKSNVGYLCQNEQYLDMNHIVYHYGQKTECHMMVNGTIKDNAKKTYRGTIDFKKGCTGSKGYEMEETLILSPATVNKSLPVILCDEDDIQGEHGATIGRLSKDVLFYMQTRGISEKEAEILMSSAKVHAVADLIPDEAIKEMIYEQI